ncbi:MAG TPA: polyketide synthase dehydratase domain-containing protein, partial [Streptosporangiaceae bacterium]
MDHPLLGAAVEQAGGDGYLLTGRVSVRSQPWLADHAVGGTVLLPGTAFAELAIRAGDAAGCGRIEELTLEEPLTLPADGAVRIQIVVSGADQSGQRDIGVYARLAEAGADGPWTRHASGRLAPAGAPDPGLAAGLAVWPPRGADPVETGDLYAALAAAGYGYGPAFRGLRAAWRRGDDVFAEVALPRDEGVSAASFGIHPALLDAALHALALAPAVASQADPAVAGSGSLDAGPGDGAGVRLPFAWSGVSLYAAGPEALRVRLRPRPGGSLSLVAADAAGQPVLSVDALALRPARPPRTAGRDVAEALFTVEWVPVAGRQPDGAASPDDPAPELVHAGTGPGSGAEPARAEVARVLELVQRWLAADQPAGARLVVVTSGAVAALPGEDVTDLAGAAVWGLVRSAQSENPGRLVLADLPAADQAGPVRTGPVRTGPVRTGTGRPGTVRAGTGRAGAEPGAAGLLAAALGSGEPEFAVRDGAVYGRRLTRRAGGLVPPGSGPWRLAVTGRGTLDDLALVPCPPAGPESGPLTAGQVRVAVRAAGLNFRDVLVALGMVGLDQDPSAGRLGSDVAGVVLETGPGVTGLAPGDRVLGITEGGFGPVTVTDARLLAPVPGGWSFTQAASVPSAYTTAWYGLVDLAGARPGQKLLVHAAAGGVGMAAVAIARHLGLEVFATASPGKHAVLASMGLDDAHIASSRSAEFAAKFPAAMDIVLNALAGELTDASLRLLRPGGAFIELGKTDIRDADQVARDHPGVRYRAFSTGEAGPDRLGRMLADIVARLGRGELAGLPVRCWDVRRAPEAFRFMSQARHTGKIVLTIPPDRAAPRHAGTILITGGTGMIGALAGQHLAAVTGAGHVLLASRSGPHAPGAAVLAAGLAGRGAAVQVTACDTAGRAALAALLAGA